MEGRQSGFSLVEVVVAVGILSLIALNVFALFAGALLAIRQAGHRLTAMSIAQGLIEDIRWKVYEDVVSDGPYEADGYGNYVYNVVVSDVTFDIPEDIGCDDECDEDDCCEDHDERDDDREGNDDDDDDGGDGDHECDDDCDGDHCCGGTNYSLKRVDVTVNWGDEERDMSVYTTYVADHSHTSRGRR